MKYITPNYLLFEVLFTYMYKLRFKYAEEYG